MNRPKNQHWVPRFYLRYFATPATCQTKEPKVWIFSKNESDGDESLTNIKNICSKRYLYSPKNESDQRSWDLESKLSELESSLSKVWENLSVGFIDLGDSTIRKGISLFVAVMYLRHPERQQEGKDIREKLIQFYEQLPVRSDGSPDVELLEPIDGKKLDPSGWAEYLSWGENDHQQFFTESIESQAIYLAEILLKKRWSIVYTESDQFITTDRPVLQQHLEKTIFGFATKGTIVVFPISQRRLLVMDDFHTEPSNQYYPLNAGALGAFNYGIWKNGSRFMISGRPIPDVLHEIVNWTDSNE